MSDRSDTQAALDVANWKLAHTEPGTVEFKAAVAQLAKALAMHRAATAESRKEQS